MECDNYNSRTIICELFYLAPEQKATTAPASTFKAPMETALLIRRVVLKGQPDEEMVMCTSSKTYALKHVETSNALLLVPPRQVGMVCPEQVAKCIEKARCMHVPGDAQLLVDHMAGGYFAAAGG